MDGNDAVTTKVARLVAVGILVLGVADVEQLLPESEVLRPERLGGLCQEPRAIGKLCGVRGDLVQLELWRRVFRADVRIQ